MYREWECVLINRENVYCAVIANVCIEREKERERERERERDRLGECV